MIINPMIMNGWRAEPKKWFRLVTKLFIRSLYVEMRNGSLGITKGALCVCCSVRVIHSEWWRQNVMRYR